RFNRSAAVADMYSPIRAGSDIAFLMGVVNYLLLNDQIHHEYVRHYTNASLIVREDYRFDEGMFSGYDETTKKYDKSSWGYELDETVLARKAMTPQRPRGVC